MQHSRSWKRGSERSDSLHLRILSFGLLQDGNVRVGVFPEGEEVLICRLSVCRVVLCGKGKGAGEGARLASIPEVVRAPRGG
jgi:hypothetical protein